MSTVALQVAASHDQTAHPFQHPKEARVDFLAAFQMRCGSEAAQIELLPVHVSEALSCICSMLAFHVVAVLEAAAADADFDACFKPCLR
jgi:hypothetical protein